MPAEYAFLALPQGDNPDFFTGFSVPLGTIPHGAAGVRSGKPSWGFERPASGNAPVAGERSLPPDGTARRLP